MSLAESTPTFVFWQDASPDKELSASNENLSESKPVSWDLFTGENTGI